MIDYSMAWVIVVCAGLLALGFWFIITRSIGNRFLRTLLRCLAAVWMLLPAPVPDYPGQFAPAYVVALFEAVFQDNGAPEHALIILGGGSVFVFVLVVTWSIVTGLRRKRLRASQAPQSPQRSEPVTPAL